MSHFEQCLVLFFYQEFKQGTFRLRTEQTDSPLQLMKSFALLGLQILGGAAHVHAARGGIQRLNFLSLF